MFSDIILVDVRITYFSLGLLCSPELVWTALYDENPYCEGKMKEKQRELMLRPSYPPIYNEAQMPHVSEISEVTVIGGDSWRVGDLVDWWASDCYWSGKITELFGDNEAQVLVPGGSFFVLQVC